MASPRMNVGQEFSRGRHDAQERQRHEAADGEQRHQVAVPGGGQVLDDFEEVEHGSMVFAMYSMCRCMRPTPLLMFTSDSRSDDGRERYGRPPAEIGAAAGDRAMGKEHPE